MGYSNKSTEEVEDIIGQNDFFHEGESLAQLDHGRVKKLFRLSALFLASF